MLINYRWIDDSLTPHEDFIGFYKVNRTTSESLVATIKDVLLLTGIPLRNCRGQCYDGTSVMAGSRAGVATKIQQVVRIEFLL